MSYAALGKFDCSCEVENCGLIGINSASILQAMLQNKLNPSFPIPLSLRGQWLGRGLRLEVW